MYNSSENVHLCWFSNESRLLERISRWEWLATQKIWQIIGPATNTMGLWNTLKHMGCLTLNPEWKFLIKNIKAPENANEALVPEGLETACTSFRSHALLNNWLPYMAVLSGSPIPWINSRQSFPRLQSSLGRSYLATLYDLMFLNNWYNSQPCLNMRVAH